MQLTKDEDSLALFLEMQRRDRERKFNAARVMSKDSELAAVLPAADHYNNNNRNIHNNNHPGADHQPSTRFANFQYGRSNLLSSKSNQISNTSIIAISDHKAPIKARDDRPITRSLNGEQEKSDYNWLLTPPATPITSLTNGDYLQHSIQTQGCNQMMFNQQIRGSLLDNEQDHLFNWTSLPNAMTTTSQISFLEEQAINWPYNNKQEDIIKTKHASAEAEQSHDQDSGMLNCTNHNMMTSNATMQQLISCQQPNQDSSMKSLESGLAQSTSRTTPITRLSTTAASRSLSATISSSNSSLSLTSSSFSSSAQYRLDQSSSKSSASTLRSEGSSLKNTMSNSTITRGTILNGSSNRLRSTAGNAATTATGTTTSSTGSSRSTSVSKSRSTAAAATTTTTSSYNGGSRSTSVSRNRATSAVASSSRSNSRASSPSSSSTSTRSALQASTVSHHADHRHHYNNNRGSNSGHSRGSTNVITNLKQLHKQPADQPSSMLLLDGYCTEPPPNLRTTISERSISNSRASRLQSANSAAAKNSTISTSAISRNGAALGNNSGSCSRSKSASRGRNTSSTSSNTSNRVLISGNLSTASSSSLTSSSSSSSTVLGSRMVQKVMHARKAGVNNNNSSATVSTALPDSHEAANKVASAPDKQQVLQHHDHDHNIQAIDKLPSTNTSTNRPAIFKDSTNAPIVLISNHDRHKYPLHQDRSTSLDNNEQVRTSNLEYHHRRNAPLQQFYVSRDGKCSTSIGHHYHQGELQEVDSKLNIVTNTSTAQRSTYHHDTMNKSMTVDRKPDHKYSSSNTDNSKGHANHAAANITPIKDNTGNNITVPNIDSTARASGALLQEVNLMSMEDQDHQLISRDDMSVELMHVFDKFGSSSAESPLVCLKHIGAAEANCEHCNSSGNNIGMAGSSNHGSTSNLLTRLMIRNHIAKRAAAHDADGATQLQAGSSSAAVAPVLQFHHRNRTVRELWKGSPF